LWTLYRIADNCGHAANCGHCGI